MGFTLVGATFLLLAGCGAPKPLAIDPISTFDDDRYDVPEPKVRSRDDYYDVLDYLFVTQVEQMLDVPRQFRHLAGKPKQAKNRTPFDEVQNSSWWTNRAGIGAITPDQIRRGPLTNSGPDTSGNWTIVRAKTQGVTPGFTIQDARGDRYVIKFDPKNFPELATGAEAIGTRLFWALGFNVPENHLVHFNPDILEIGAKTKVKEGRKKRLMTQADLQGVLDRVPFNSDGSIRAIASRYLQGKIIGPPKWGGRRKDDLNDVIRHEHRREIRGYRVFSSWLHHNDCREINALDVYIEERGRHFVKHYLIDFGAILGSRSNRDNLRSEGHEYLVDFGEMSKAFVTLGGFPRQWTRYQFPTIRGVGRFQSKHFNPGNWKPDYPNPAFDNLTHADAFWAAKIVMNFSDEMIRAAVDVARFSDPMAAEYISKILIERRDLIGRHWFSRVNALGHFRVERPQGAPILVFEDLETKYGFSAARSYRVEFEIEGHDAIVIRSGEQRVSLGLVRDILLDQVSEDMKSRLVKVTLWSMSHLEQLSPEMQLTLYLDPDQGRFRVVRIDYDS